MEYISPNVGRLLGISAQEIEADPQKLSMTAVPGSGHISIEVRQQTFEIYASSFIHEQLLGDKGRLQPDPDGCADALHGRT